MTKLGDKIKTALDESRMLILGSQILLGVQFREILEKNFGTLPLSSQYIGLSSLLILLVEIALIMWPGAYHRIVWNGKDRVDVHEFTTTVMDFALLPFLLALALELYVVAAKLLGSPAGLAVAIAVGLVAFIFWYGLGFLGHYRGWDKELHSHPASKEDEKVEHTKINDRIEQVLVEARVVLPGAQALLGFQFATILVEGFDQLPTSSRYIHFISLALMGLTVILLMSPAAYHRIVENGEDTEHFHKVASVFLLAAMIPLPLGICGDLFVVIRKIVADTSISVICAAVMLLLFYGLWFGFTAYRRTRMS